MIGGYLIAYAVLLITGARLGQTHGYRRVFLLGVAVFTAASLVCGLAPTPLVLIAARIAQGAGAALMFPQTLTGIQLNFTGSARARAIGLYAVALSTGAVAGQLLGGVLISADLGGIGWRPIFLINVPVGVALLVAGWRHLPADVARTSRRLDLRGVAALSAAVMLLVLPLVLGQELDWPLWSWICLVASVPAAVLFTTTQRRRLAAGGAPLVNLGILAQRPVGWGLLTMLTTTSTYSVPDRYAPDISGVITTTMQIGAVIGVATLGTLYLGLAGQPGPAHATHATHAFAVVSIAFAVVAVLATAMAARSTHTVSSGN